jgi:hypothetical protein
LPAPFPDSSSRLLCARTVVVRDLVHLRFYILAAEVLNLSACDESGRLLPAASQKKIGLCRSGSTRYLSMKQLVKDLIHRTVSLWRRIIFSGLEEVWHGNCFIHWHAGRT